MKIAFAVIIFPVALTGCQSGLYKVTTSEDEKNVDSSVRYYEVESTDAFLKDSGEAPDGILYDEDQMPVVIDDGSVETTPDKPGWSGVLWMFSLGIFPMFHSEYMTQTITVKTPIGEKTGSYRLDAKRWAGWIPLFVGYPGSADERDTFAQLPNRRLEGVGRDRLVKYLVGEFSRDGYLAFAKAKNKVRQDELARIKGVSKKVDELIAAQKFDDAEALISRESRPQAATRKCDEASWKDMSQRVVKAHMDFDKKRVETLISSDKFEEAIAVCDAKDSVLGDAKESLRSKALEKGFEKLLGDVSKRVDDCIAKDSYTEADEIIKNATRSPFVANRGGFGGPAAQFSDIQTRVNEASKAHDKKHAQSLIEAGKYEEAIAYCDKVADKFRDADYAFGVKRASVTDQLKRESVTKAIKELKDIKRLVVIMKMISDTQLRDDVVMRLRDLNAVAQLSRDERMEIVKTTKREDVVSAVVDVTEEKAILVSMLSMGLNEKIIKSIFVKLADPDVIRNTVWGSSGNNEMRNAYISVFGSDAECKKLMENFPDAIGGFDVVLLKKCCVDSMTRAAIDNLKLRHIESEIDELPDGEKASRVLAISDPEVRSKVAMKILYLLPEHLGEVRADIRFVNGSPRWHAKNDELKVYQKLVGAVLMADRESRVKQILEGCKSKIHFEGFYVGMSLQDFYIMSEHTGQTPSGWAPPLPKFHTGNQQKISFEDAMEDLISRSMESFLDTSFKRLVFDRKARFALAELEDGEFWTSFMRKYIPQGRKKSLGESINEVLDSSSYKYQEGYDDDLKEDCFIYKSMKYGTKVLFGTDSGKLVLEKYE